MYHFKYTPPPLQPPPAPSLDPVSDRLVDVLERLRGRAATEGDAFHVALVTDVGQALHEICRCREHLAHLAGVAR